LIVLNMIKADGELIRFDQQPFLFDDSEAGMRAYRELINLVGHHLANSIEKVEKKLNEIERRGVNNGQPNG